MKFGWLLLAAAFPAQAAEDPCAIAENCRQVTDVRVQSPDGAETLVPVNQSLPWVVHDNLLLVPGDWIIFRLIRRDDALAPELVKAGSTGTPPEPAEGEIQIILPPFDSGSLTMKVLSRHPETLDYAALVVVGKDGAQRTSVCSLMPGVTMFESWQWPIRQMALWAFRPTTEPGCKTLDLKKAGRNTPD